MFTQISDEESLAAAMDIASTRPFEQSEGVPTRQFFFKQMKIYFPEFSGCATGLFSLYRTLFVGDEDFPPACWEITGPFINESYIRDISRNRSLVYAAEYVYPCREASMELWSVLSFGVPLPEHLETGETVYDPRFAEALAELMDIWDSGLALAYGCAKKEWTTWIARYKVAGDDYFLGLAEDAGIDLMVEAYFSGVPADQVIGG